MIQLKTPRGLAVEVPEKESEDPSPKFGIDNLADFRRYYLENGYAIIKNLYSAEQCQHIRKLWEGEVKPFKGFMYRQATAKAERHVKNDKGWIMNPILNLQSVDPDYFPQFRRYATDTILANGELGKAFKSIFDDEPKVVQSMYFEGNSATWEHQDSYYLDSETIGEMAAAWIALEDIVAEAGRFFICPKSHKIKLDDHSLHNNIVENHEGYIGSVVAKIKEEKLPIRAPLLNQGDVLFWNALTIHGSLDSQDANRPRSSITCHAIPNKKKFLQLQTRVLDPAAESINGVNIHRPKDLEKPKNKAIFFVETKFPNAFYWLKKRAILYALTRKSA